MHILLVEKTCSSTAPLLDVQHSVITSAEDADEAFSLLRHDGFDLVVINLGAHASAGFALIRRMRSARNDTPVLAVTGRAAADRAKALTYGADDAVSIPLDEAELRARLTSVLRRSRGFSHSLLQVGDLALCMTTKQVRFRNSALRLTPKETAILEVMMLRRGTVVAKASLLTQLYGGVDEPESKIIDVFICKLRRKLEQAGAVGYIGTAWGHGYVLTVPAESLTLEERIAA
jgi:two-component system, cell cycle response regulator CtrA